MFGCVWVVGCGLMGYFVCIINGGVLLLLRFFSELPALMVRLLTYLWFCLPLWDVWWLTDLCCDECA